MINRIKKTFSTRKRRFFALIILFIFLMPLALRGLLLTKEAAAWWNDEYAYRQEVNFTHNADITSERRVTFSLDTAELITANVMQSDCDDTRFTDANGKILRYELTGTCNNAATTYEIVFPSIVNGTNVFYVYYGNPSAGSASEDVSAVTELTPSGGDPSVTDRTNEEKGPTPVAFLKFDEGYGSTANDNSSQNNDGSISGATWQTNDLCISEKCLFLDGIDDVVTVTNADSIDFDSGLSGGFTISAWIRVNSDGENSTGEIVDKGTNTYIRVDSEGSDGFADLEANLDLGTTDANVNITDGITLDRWHHIAVTHDGTSTITVFIDGLNKGSNTGSGTMASDANNLLIGGDTSNNFHGFIDEFKVYNYERTEDEIKTDAIINASDRGSAQVSGDNKMFLSDGLVGYWMMNEASADSCTGGSNDSCDSSGNVNDGLWNGNTAATSAKFGRGTTFDGTGDYINVANDASLGITADITLAAWVKRSATDNYGGLIAKTNGSDRWDWDLFICDGSTCPSGASDLDKIGFYSDSTSPDTIIFDATISDTTTWHQVVFTRNTSEGTARVYIDGDLKDSQSISGNFNNNADPVRIATDGPTYDAKADFSGAMDEVRIYNRALSSAEINTLYNWGPGPVGHWKLDENTGTNANDTSGNENTGTLTNSPTWTPGKFGSAVDFERSNSQYTTIADDPTLSSLDAMTVSAWIKIEEINTADQMTIVGHWSSSSGTREFLFEVDTDGTVDMNDANNNVATSNALSEGQWYHVAGVLNINAASTERTKIYVNGALDDVGTGRTTSRDANLPITIGARDTGSTDQYFDGIIDDVRIYNYERTPTQILEDMNAGHPVPGSPVGSPQFYYRFDTGFGSTAYDLGPNKYNLSTGTDEDWTADGKFGSALKARGTGYAFAANHPKTEFTANENFTLSLWFKSQSATNPASDEYILDMQNGTGYAIYANTSGNAVFGIDTDGTWTPADTATSSNDVYDGNWHHVAARKTGTDKIEIFIDGQLKGSDTSLSATGELANTARIVLGAQDITPTAPFNGDIDEFSLYRTALTDEQIKLLYNHKSAIVWGSTHTDSSGEVYYSASKEYCPPGHTDTCDTPLGHWPLDENTGQIALTKVSHDDVLNYELVFGGSATEEVDDPVWAKGKIGAAVEFDGIDDHIVQTGDPQGLDFVDGDDFSLEAWIWRDTSDTEDAIIDKKGALGTPPGYSFYIDDSNDNIVLQVADGSDTYSVQSTSTITSPGWHHIVAVFDDDTEANIKIYLDGKDVTGTKTGTLANIDSLDNNRAFEVGQRSANPRDHFDGKLDNVIVYKYARTQAQVSWQYNQGRPIGWWRFDECSGTTTNDASGNANSGTITPGSGTYTSAGTCGGNASTEMWAAGSSGKLNSSLGFDGDDDYVNVPTDSVFGITGDITLAAWIKRGAIDDFGGIMAKTDGSTRWDYDFSMCGLASSCPETGGGANKLSFYSDGLTPDTVYSTGTITDTNWHHVVVSRSGSTVTFYIDGKKSGSSSMSGDFNNNSDPVRIGTNGPSWSATSMFNGQIDDVRIYNYTLSEQQIRTIMNEGAVRFGPSEGSP